MPLALVTDLVTSNLDWHDHTYKICKKANNMLGLLRRCTLEFQNPQTRRLLYLTIVRSNVSYASQLWAPQKVELITEMEKVQQRASKFILNLAYHSEITYKETPTVPSHSTGLLLVRTARSALSVQSCTLNDTFTVWCLAQLSTLQRNACVVLQIMA